MQFKKTYYELLDDVLRALIYSFNDTCWLKSFVFYSFFVLKSTNHDTESIICF